MELEVVVHHDAETGGYWGEVVQLPGCFAAGHTRAELDESLQEAVSLYLEDHDVATVLIADRIESVERYRLSEDRKLERVWSTGRPSDCNQMMRGLSCA